MSTAASRHLGYRITEFTSLAAPNRRALYQRMAATQITVARYWRNPIAARASLFTLAEREQMAQDCISSARGHITKARTINCYAETSVSIAQPDVCGIPTEPHRRYIPIKIGAPNA